MHLNHKIAVVGTACRFPGGANDLDAYWKLLLEGRDAVRDDVEMSWDKKRFLHPEASAPGRTTTVSAGVIENPHHFDADFFNISPREAVNLDSQQILALELSWEMFEDAGIPPSQLKNEKVGVYIGVASQDEALCRADDICLFNSHSMLGINLSIIANRLSHFYGFTGPSMAIDTACSSALAALHQACRALRNDELPYCVAGGLNVLTGPLPFVGFSKAGMLSPRGRCRMFDASADGYARAEGGGLALLKPLDAALRDGNRILGVIAATGVNANGAHPGLASPSRKAQAELINEVFRKNRLPRTRLAYVEAHGTGTAAGDPVEAAALGDAFPPARRGTLWVGSAKTNVGHMETASGMAGLFKAMLALQHGIIPPNLHFEAPNPKIDFSGWKLAVPVRPEPLPKVRGNPLAVVNSFGFGGANAIAVLEKPPEPDGAAAWASPPPDGRLVQALPISAQSRESLRALAGAYAERLEAHPETPVAPIAAAAMATRESMSCRLVVAGAGRDPIREGLLAFADAGHARGALSVSGDARFVGQGAAFAYSGNGGVWPGMGRELLKSDRAFAETVEAVDAVIRPEQGWSVAESLANPPPAEALRKAETAQPLLFAVQAGLTAALAARGVRPDAVFGHSIGEVAAAWAAGALDLREAALLTHRRCQLPSRVYGEGTMAALGVSAEEAAALAAEIDPELEIASINAPNSVTLAGPAESLRAMGKEAKKLRRLFVPLDIPYPFHSSRLNRLRDVFLSSLPPLAPRETRIPMYSTVDGGRVDGRELDAEYWWRNIVRPVRFLDASRAALEAGIRLFLEIGPAKTLDLYIKETARCDGLKVAMIPSLLKDKPPDACLERCWMTAWTEGWPVDWSVSLPPPSRVRLELPRYPWKREPYLRESSAECLGAVYGRVEHILLGRALREGGWENQLDAAVEPWLADHRAGGRILLPAAGFAEMALAAAGRHWKGEAPGFENLRLRRPMELESGSLRVIAARLDPDTGFLTVDSRKIMARESPVRHAEARLLSDRRFPERPSRREWIGNPPDHFQKGPDPERLYADLAAAGLCYGPHFRVIEATWRSDRQVLTRLAKRPVAPDSGLLLSPALLDGAFQSLWALFGGRRTRRTFVPYWIGRMALALGAEPPAYALATLERHSAGAARANFELIDAGGRVVAWAENCHFAALPARETEKPRRLRTVLAPADPGTPAIDPAGLAARLRTRSAAEKDPGDAANASAAPENDSLDALMATLLEAQMHERFPVSGVLLDEPAIGRRIAARQFPYFFFLLEMLESRGGAVRTPAGWRLTRRESVPELPSAFRAFLAARPEAVVEARLLALAASAIAPALDGHEPPATAAVKALISQLPGVRQANAVLLAALRDIAANLPAGGRLRVAATGVEPSELADSLDEALGGAAARVCLFDADAAVVEDMRLRCAERAGWDAVRYAPREGGLESGAFDVLLVFQTLHQLCPTRRELASLAGLLASGGVLAVSERMPAPLYDLAEGLRPEWWAASESPARPVSLLRDEKDWLRQFSVSGLESAEAIAISGAEDVRVFVGRRPRTAEAALPPPAPASVKTSAPEERAAVWFGDADSSRPASALAKALEEKWRSAGRAFDRAAVGGGGGTAIKPLEPDSWAGFFRNFAGTAAAETRRDLFFAVGFDTDPDDADPYAAQEKRVTAAAMLARGWWTAGRPPCRLWLLGGGGLPAAGFRPAPSQAGLWGVGRTLMNEMPGLDIRLADIQAALPGGIEAECLVKLADMAAGGSNEREAVIADGRLHYPRLETAAAGTGAPIPPDGAGVTLTMPADDSRLLWVRAVPPKPGPGQAAVRVEAAGLNYRDALWAARQLPEQALENGYSGPTLGLEGAGVITETGAGVDDLARGDRVMFIAPQCLASHTATDRAMIARLPAGLSASRAATIPVAFCTAWYSLKHLARMRAGESLLIHGAAGGVGLAALQIARRLELKVWAGAGSAEKRHFLAALGADHVFDSRSLSFAREVLDATGGRGVDAVLNSVAGEAARRSLSCLAPFGRFLELGKRDFYANAEMRLHPFRNNLSYMAVDLDQLARLDPDQCREIMAEITELFAAGAFTPLPHARYAAADVGKAFRDFREMRHAGKIVVDLSAPVAPTKESPAPFPPPREDGCHLVAGGVRGFGLAAAQWLFDNGCRRLALLSRGEPPPEAEHFAARARGQGGMICFVQADMAEFDTLKVRLDEAVDALGPLRGVIHAAAVYDDAPVAELTPGRIAGVMRPKALGAWNLHRYVRDMPLDYFVLFSSAAALFGNPGQAAYSAANACLATLAAWRRACGLPALAVEWGAVGDAGEAARRKKTSNALRRLSVGTDAGAEAYLDMLPELAAGSDPVQAAAPAPRGDFHRLPAFAAPFFSRVRGRASRNAEEDLLGLLRELPPDKALKRLVRYMAERIAVITEVPLARITDDAPLGNLGMDSLSFMELRNELEKTLQQPMPDDAVAPDATIRSLAERFLVGMFDHSGMDDVSRDGRRLVRQLARRHGVQLDIEPAAPEKELNFVQRRD